MKCKLEVEEFKFETDCDGCDGKIPPNEKLVGGIDSCCGGGCSRSLCASCVAFAYNLLGLPINKGQVTTKIYL